MSKLRRFIMSKFVNEVSKGVCPVEPRHHPGGYLPPGERMPTIDEIATACIEAFDIFSPAIEEILQRRENNTSDF